MADWAVVEDRDTIKEIASGARGRGRSPLTNALIEGKFIQMHDPNKARNVYSTAKQHGLKGHLRSDGNGGVYIWFTKVDGSLIEPDERNDA